ncbi:MAG: DUF493 domain-containing protein [Gammaproteobacteria bacterium]|nr:DUF493 domain-containing protein [Gammaproteobacteria bacterium]
MPVADHSLLKFPCDFPLKVMGRAASDFDALVVGIVRRHVEALSEDAVQCRPSMQGNYLAVTVTIQAHSREQLDGLYRELSAHARILMVL